MESKYKQTINDFVDSTYKYDSTGNYKDDTMILTIKNVLQKAEDYSDSIQKPLFRFSKQDFVDLFNENKWVNGRSNFSFCKSRITRYLNYLHDTDPAASMQYLVTLKELASLRIKDLENEVLRDFYFGSESDFLAFIDYLPERFLTTKLVFLLYWLGFSRDEVVELTFDDMDESNFSIASRKASREVFERINQLSHVDSYSYTDDMNRKRAYYVYSSKYLLRPAYLNLEMEAVDKITTSTIHIRTLRMVEYLTSINSNYASMKLNAKRLAVNNRFCIMYEYELKTGVFPKKYFCNDAEKLPLSFPNSSIFMRFTEQYRQWRKVFHPINLQ